MKKILLIIAVLLAATLGATSKQETKKESIAVFIPGVVAGSPIYEELDQGVREVASLYSIDVKTIEGGFNPGDWPNQIKDIAASGEYSLIVSSNPSIPQIFQEVSKDFPNQKFICMDGKLKGNSSIYTAEYQQYDQAYMAGYLAGLVTTGTMEGANPQKKVGLIIAHNYPVLDNIIIPGFLDGLNDVDSEIIVDQRVVGNWWDATKAAELSKLMIDDGVDVFLSIAGGANQGVITQCQDRGKYLVHFDSNGYSKAPGTVVGSTIIKQRELTAKIIKEYLEGETPFGTADTFSAKDGYVDFISDDPLYIESVPQDIRDEMERVVKKIKE